MSIIFVICFMSMILRFSFFFFFFFNDTATTEIYPLSLHDALPIFHLGVARDLVHPGREVCSRLKRLPVFQHAKKQDRKSTRLNSSHTVISYAVFCLKKKKNYDYDSSRAY